MAVLAVISLYLASAACSDIVACQNQNNDYYCAPTDTSCKYVKFKEDIGKCVIDASFTDTDNDIDGWSNGCDAFLDNNKEWMDIDGDGIGHNSDCDDFNPSEKDTCPRSGGSLGGARKNLCAATWSCTEWSECVDGSKTRTCSKTNDCEIIVNKPEEWEGCPNYVILKPSSKSTPQEDNVIIEPEVEVIDTSNPEEEKDRMGNQLTGQAFNLASSGMTIGGILLLLLLILLLLFVFFKRRKKEEEQ